MYDAHSRWKGRMAFELFIRFSHNFPLHNTRTWWMMTAAAANSCWAQTNNQVDNEFRNSTLTLKLIRYDARLCWQSDYENLYIKNAKLEQHSLLMLNSSSDCRKYTRARYTVRIQEDKGGGPSRNNVVAVCQACLHVYLKINFRFTLFAYNTSKNIFISTSRLTFASGLLYL